MPCFLHSKGPGTLSPPTRAAGIKAPSGLLAAVVAAVAPATSQGPIRWGELARDQLTHDQLTHDQPTLQETQDVLTSNTGLLLEMVMYQGANL